MGKHREVYSKGTGWLTAGPGQVVTQDIGLSVTLPAAGTYLVGAAARNGKRTRTLHAGSDDFITDHGTWLAPGKPGQVLHVSGGGFVTNTATGAYTTLTLPVTNGGAGHLATTNNAVFTNGLGPTRTVVAGPGVVVTHPDGVAGNPHCDAAPPQPAWLALWAIPVAWAVVACGFLVGKAHRARLGGQDVV